MSTETKETRIRMQTGAALTIFAAGASLAYGHPDMVIGIVVGTLLVMTIGSLRNKGTHGRSFEQDYVAGAQYVDDLRQRAWARFTKAPQPSRHADMQRIALKYGGYRFSHLSSVLTRMRSRGVSRRHRSPSRRQRVARAGPSDDSGSKPADFPASPRAKLPHSRKGRAR